MPSLLLKRPKRLRGHGGLLDYAAVGGQVAEEDGDAAGGHVGVVDGPDGLRVQVDGVRNVFAHRFAGA